jgi:hypothetical protein
MRITIDINVQASPDREGETAATAEELTTRTRDAIAERLEELLDQFRAEGVEVSARTD